MGQAQFAFLQVTGGYVMQKPAVLKPTEANRSLARIWEDGIGVLLHHHPQHASEDSQD